MKMKTISFYMIILIAMLLTAFNACKKETTYDEGSLAINEFIWEGMNYNYLWYDNVNDLRDERFSSDKEKRDYLIPFNDHEELFYSLLYSERDRFSWIVDDYVALEKLFQGITFSMGYRYSLFGFSGELIGVVKYVIDNSPADRAGLKRGDLFRLVDGTTITELNYQDLLSNKTNYILTMADIVNSQLQSTNTVSMIAEEVYENPVYYTDIIETGGKTVGYLYYAGFRSNYEIELNNAFGEFANHGVNELVLDLRYNGGGSVSTTAKLGSMIYDTDTDKIFIRKTYNDKYTTSLMEEYGESAFYWTLKDEIIDPEGQTVALNSLGLDHIYVLATGSSASASELLINCLRAYIDVTIIGTTTYGKNVGSITVKDYDNEGNINPDHTWAMQPIISESSNVNYVSDYHVGFEPDYMVKEDYTMLLPFGDQDEPMLKTALDLINGISPSKSARIIPAYSIIMNSEEFDRWNFEMIDEIY